MVFMFLPYHFATDWIIRQAICEFCAYAFIPLIFLGFDNAIKQKKCINYINWSSGDAVVPSANCSACHAPIFALSVGICNFTAQTAL